MIDICTLGTGGSLPMPDRALSSLYVRVNGRALLIDCGEGTQVQIRKLGWGFRCIDALLITHYHGDHCSGLPGFLLSLAKAGRDKPFHIWGPPGLNRIYEGLMVIAPTLTFPVILHELSMTGGIFEQNEFQVTAFPLNHGVPCLGYRLEYRRLPAFDPAKAQQLNIPVSEWKNLQRGNAVTLADRIIHPEQVFGQPKHSPVIIFATDTRPVKLIYELGHEADCLILEGMYGEEEKMPQALKNHHMLFREAAEIAKEANAKFLLLTHFSTCIEDPTVFLDETSKVFSKVKAARDVGCFVMDAEGHLSEKEIPDHAKKMEAV